jgi:hypothetical protein
MFRNPIICLILVLSAMLSCPAHAAKPLTTFVAYFYGHMDIAPDGMVQEYSLAPSLSPQAPIKDALDRRIRSWRFEPVAQAGQPTVARVLFELRLQAERNPGNKEIPISLSKVRFYDPPARDSSGKAMKSLRPPEYPECAVCSGVGANVLLLLKLDENGHVIEKGISEMELLVTSRMDSLEANSWAKQFRKSALDGAQGWIFPASNRQSCGQPCLVEVPVRYSISDTVWSGVLQVPTTPLPWATPQTPIVGLGMGGALASTRKLRDPGQAEGKL